VEGAIQGVTLDLTGTSPGDTGSVVVERDSAALKEAAQGFVSAFNTMKSSVGRMTNVTGDADTAGELVGDRAVRTIESRLSRDLTGPVAGGELAMLADVGIQLDENGQLTLDEAKLDAAIADTPDALGEFFAGADEVGGMAGRLDATLGQVLGNDGLIKGAIQSSESRVDSLDRRFERTEASVERTIDRYRKQFGQLDGLIASMNQTGDYLTQQLDMLGAQMSQ
ncbi:MAG: flagellar filament capping protein FliD, partial [Halomonas sp.]